MVDRTSRRFRKGTKGLGKAGHHFFPPINRLAIRDRAREARLGQPEGKGTGRSEGSDLALQRIVERRTYR